MGLYCTTTSLQTIMVGTTFDTVTTSLAGKLITHAENEVNKWISKRYDIGNFNTSTAIPPLLTSLAETLAEGYMVQRMGRGGKESLAHSKMLIEQATNNLKMISEYKLDLIDSSGDVVQDMSQTSYRVMSSTSEYSDTFGEDDPMNWAVDQDKLDDIDADRD